MYLYLDVCLPLIDFSWMKKKLSFRGKNRKRGGALAVYRAHWYTAMETSSDPESSSVAMQFRGWVHKENHVNDVSTILISSVTSQRFTQHSFVPLCESVVWHLSLHLAFPSPHINGIQINIQFVSLSCVSWHNFLHICFPFQQSISSNGKVLTRKIFEPSSWRSFNHLWKTRPPRPGLGGSYFLLCSDVLIFLRI